MVDCDRADVVCLHLAAHDDARAQTPAPPALTSTGIGDALELGRTAADRLALLEDLTALQERGLVTASERPVRGQATPQTVYALTEAGREHARRVRERVVEATVEVTNGTETEVPLGAIDRYLEDTATPLVTALARHTAHGRVPIDTHDPEGFVDREEPLAAVRSAVEGSFRREPRTVLVGGAVGMGKTALVDAAVERVTYDPAPVVARGICGAGPTAPYGPLRQAFEGVADDGDVLAELAESEGDVPDDPADVDARRRALFGDVADALRAVAADRPVVVFLDNLQWADRATLALFEHLATALTAWIYPVAFVGTYRTPAAVTGDAPFADVRDRLVDAGATDLTLEPLDRAATRALVEGVVGTHTLPAAFVDLVHDWTGGVPLFVRETVQHLLDQGVVDPAADAYPTRSAGVALPDAVTEGIADRLSVLDAASRELVELAAVVGERVPRAVLAAASDRSAAERREYLDLLVAIRILERSGEGAEGEPVAGDAGPALRFVSAGVRETVVEQIADDRATAYHERVGTALADVADADEAAARIAHHFEQAGDAERAVEYYRRAGDHATGTFANDVAVTNYERALSLGRSSDAVADATLAAVAADLAGVHRRTGAYDTALETIDEGLARAPDRSRAQCQLLEVKSRVHNQTGAYDPARAAAERQRDLATAIDAPDLEAAALDRLGAVAWKQGAYDEAHEFHARSRDVSRDIGDREGETRSLHNLGAVAHYRREYDRAREYYEESLALAREIGAPDRETATLNNLGVIAREQGDYEQALEYFERTLAADRDRGNRDGEATTLMNLGLVAQEQGAYDRAREYYEQSIDIHRDLGNRRGETTSLHNLGMVDFGQGAYDTAREHFERSLAIERDLDNSRGIAQSLGVLGRVARERGDYDRAREHFEESLTIARDIGDDKVAATKLVDLARVARLVGDYDRARASLDRALSTYEEIEKRGGIAKVWLERGRLALARGDPSAAREHADRALDAYTDMERTHLRGETRLLLGRVAAAEGAAGEARDHWRAALAAFESVEAPQDVLAALEELVGACREQGDTDQARTWIRQAQAVLADAPDPTADQHRTWVQQQAAALDEA